MIIWVWIHRIFPGVIRCIIILRKIRGSTSTLICHITPRMTPETNYRHISPVFIWINDRFRWRLTSNYVRIIKFNSPFTCLYSYDQALKTHSHSLVNNRPTRKVWLCEVECLQTAHSRHLANVHAQYLL